MCEQQTNDPRVDSFEKVDKSKLSGMVSYTMPSPVGPRNGGERLQQVPFEETLDGRWFSFIQPDVAKWGGTSEAREIACWRGGMAPCSARIGSAAAWAGRLAAAARCHGHEGFAEVDANPNPLREECSR